MTVDEVIRKLRDAGLAIKEQKRTSDNYGEVIRFASGEIVNVYDTGSVAIQGTNQSRVNEILGISQHFTSPAAAFVATVSRRVFVAYGHDSVARTQLDAMLRRWGMDPLLLDQLPSAGLTIIDKLEKYSSGDVCFAIVLATPDDEGFPRGKSDQRRYRARQNVVLELGMLFAKLGRGRVAILLKDQKNMERPSDIDGLIYLPFEDSVEEVKLALAKELGVAGIHVDLAKL